MFVKLALSFGYFLLFILLRTDIACGIDIQPNPPSASLSSSTIKPVIHDEIKNISEPSSTTEPIRINHDRTIAPSATETQSLTSSTDATIAVDNKIPHISDSDETAKHKKDHSIKNETEITSTSTTPSTTTSTTIHTTEKAKSSSDLPRSNDSKSDNITEPKSKQPIETTITAAGIVASVCVGIASSACVGLIVWKCMYRKRHGNREILVNEEDVDFNDEDLRHFEATCIQLEPDA